MKISRKDLERRWLWTMVPAFVLFLIVSTLDDWLRVSSGFGVHEGPAHLQAFAHWLTPTFAAGAGFILGLDYLFLLLYALGFYFSGIVAREAFAPRPGFMRRLFDLLALVPLVGALCGVFANGLEIWMLIKGPAQTLAFLAGLAIAIRISTFCLGVLLFIAALVARFRKPKPSA